MEELFTQRAQLVLEIAQDEAKSLSISLLVLSIFCCHWLLNRMELLGKYYVKLD